MEWMIIWEDEGFVISLWMNLLIEVLHECEPKWRSCRFWGKITREFLEYWKYELISRIASCNFLFHSFNQLHAIHIDSLQLYLFHELFVHLPTLFDLFLNKSLNSISTCGIKSSINCSMIVFSWSSFVISWDYISSLWVDKMQFFISLNWSNPVILWFSTIFDICAWMMMLT